MAYCTLESIFQSPWGIVGHRRAEIESGSFGVFDKILGEEVANRFLHADMVAALLEAHPSTTRRWLDKVNTRFIIHNQKKLFFKDDVDAVAAERNAWKAKAKVERKNRTRD